MGRKKLLNRYLGPYKIVARKGAAAYALGLPVCMGKTHRVCHVSLLKRCKDNCRGSAPPPAVLPDARQNVRLKGFLLTVAPCLGAGLYMCSGKVASRGE